MFHHYADFWVIDTKTRSWTKLESGKSKGPSARSGARMAYNKDCVVLFGGFISTSSDTMYLIPLAILLTNIQTATLMIFGYSHWILIRGQRRLSLLPCNRLLALDSHSYPVIRVLYSMVDIQ